MVVDARVGTVIVNPERCGWFLDQPLLFQLFRHVLHIQQQLPVLLESC